MSKILIIDDSLTIVRTLEAFLKRNGYEIYTADDGVRGLELAKTIRPDLILLDIMLPKLSGYEVCNILKMDTAYSHIKIIMFTAKMSTEAKTLSQETGADDFMTKDSDPEFILDKIKGLIK